MMKMATQDHLVDEWELAFQNCLSALTNHEHMNVTDSEETKTSVELCIQKYLDIARQLENFFLQKRFILSIHRPEHIISEDVMELRQELQRKEALLSKHTERLQHWQSMLSSRSQGTSQPASATAQPPQPQGQAQVQAQTGTPQVTAPHGAPQTQAQPQGGFAVGQGQVQMVTQPQTSPGQGMINPGTGQANHLQGPLAFLQQTTSNIGMPERR